jgi:hypothetical protein
MRLNWINSMQVEKILFTNVFFSWSLCLLNMFSSMVFHKPFYLSKTNDRIYCMTDKMSRHEMYTKIHAQVFNIVNWYILLVCAKKICLDCVFKTKLSIKKKIISSCICWKMIYKIDQRNVYRTYRDFYLNAMDIFDSM